MILLRDKHGRDGVKWALENWAKDPITCSAIVGGQMNGYRTTHPQGSTYLHATNDPYSVGQMIEFEAHRCGVTIRGNSYKLDKILVYWFVEPDDSLCRRTFDLIEARGILAELLDLSEGDAEGARKVLRGTK